MCVCFLFSSIPRIFELQDQLNVVQDQLNQVNSDMAHLHGERNDKYMELKKREESMKGQLVYIYLSKAPHLDSPLDLWNTCRICLVPTLVYLLSYKF